jgi:hypothetical protein
LGFVDDGGEHSGKVIHTGRVPLRAGAQHFWLQDIKVLHYQYVDWKRMQSKHRWYQCWERVEFPNKPPHTIYRLYHHMYSIPASLARKIDPQWLEGYEKCGIDMRTVRREDSFWWDAEVATMIRKHGANVFRRIDIWDDACSWASEGGDPRRILDRAVLRYLRWSQVLSRWLLIRLVDRLLVVVGW